MTLARTLEEADAFRSDYSRRLLAGEIVPTASFNHHTGKIFVFMPKIDSAKMMKRALQHEILGHEGVLKFFPDDLVWEGAMLRLVTARPDLVKDLGASYTKRPGSEIMDMIPIGKDAEKLLKEKRNYMAGLGEEVVAQIAETKPMLNSFELMMAKHRRWLRSNIPALEEYIHLSDREIIREYVIPLRIKLANEARKQKNIKALLGDKA